MHNYRPFSAEELLSLLSSGSLGEEDLEELLAASSRTREGRLGAMYDDQLLAQEIRSWVTLADRCGHLHWLHSVVTMSALFVRAATGGGPSMSAFPGSSAKTGPGSSQMLSSSAPIHFCGQSVFWDEDKVSLLWQLYTALL